VEINCPHLWKFFSCSNPLVLSVFLCDELCSFDVWNADGVYCSSLDVQIAPGRLGEFQGQWFSESSGGGYEKLWCSNNALPLYRLSQPEEIRTTGGGGGGMWNKKSILWELEYWLMLDVRRSIDNMHVNKNVCEATC
jgi:hypothetical protein